MKSSSHSRSGVRAVTRHAWIIILIAIGIWTGCEQYRPRTTEEVQFLLDDQYHINDSLRRPQSQASQLNAVSFIVTGDPRHLTGPNFDGPLHFRNVCESISATGQGEFLIMCGDLWPGESAEWTIRRYIGEDYTWYPAVGNHDVSDDNMPWMRQHNAGGTTLPNIVNSGPPGCLETMYSFDYSNCHFVVLNVYYSGQKDTGAPGVITASTHNWLQADLAGTEKEHIFVVGHEPAYPQPDMDTGDLRHVGSSLDRDPPSRDAFWELLKAHNVVAYLCAHTHCYSHYNKDGVWQIDVGRARPWALSANSLSTYCRIEVAGRNVVLITYRQPKGQAEYFPLYALSLR
jgi:hypothetical protein